MEDKLLKRLEELSNELESHVKERDFHATTLRRLDARIKDISAIIFELKSLLEKD